MGALAFMLTAQVAVAQPAPEDPNLRWVASPAVSSLHEPFGVLFEPRYPDLQGGAQLRDSDLDALRAELPRLDAGRLAAARGAVQSRLTAVRHWQQEFAAIVANPEVDPSRRQMASDVHQRLALEASTLELQLDMLGRASGGSQVDAALTAPVREQQQPQPRGTYDEKTAFGDDLWIAAGEHVSTAVVVGGTLRVAGRVKDAVAVGGDIIVLPGGVIEGDTVVVLGSLRPASDGTSNPALDEAPAAEAPRVVRPEGAARRARSSGVGATAVWFLTLLGMGAITAGALPDQVGRVADAIDRRPGWSLVLGAIGIPGLLLASALLAITLVGAPVALAVLALLGASLVLGAVALSQSIADRLPGGRSDARWLVLGAVALAVALMSALPWVAQLLLVCGLALGSGAALGSRLGRG